MRCVSFAPHKPSTMFKAMLLAYWAFPGMLFPSACVALAVDLEARRAAVGFLLRQPRLPQKSCLCSKLYTHFTGLHRFKRPVRFWLERFDDMAISGNRHPFRFDYRFALDANGKFAAMEVNAFSNCGYSWDLSRGVMGNFENSANPSNPHNLERTMAHIDCVYKFGNLDVYGHLCRTNLASNTAFRGFGAPQAMFGTETILKQAAEQFGLDVDQVMCGYGS